MYKNIIVCDIYKTPLDIYNKVCYDTKMFVINNQEEIRQWQSTVACGIKARTKNTKEKAGAAELVPTINLGYVCRTLHHAG